MKLVYMGTAGHCPRVPRKAAYRRIRHRGGLYQAGHTEKPGHEDDGLGGEAVRGVGGPAVIQPVSFRDDAVVEELRAIAPDLIVVVAYGKILPQRVLDIPKYGCINMHASILPELRGAGPVQWSILNHCRRDRRERDVSDRRDG